MGLTQRELNSSVVNETAVEPEPEVILVSNEMSDADIEKVIVAHRYPNPPKEIVDAIKAYSFGGRSMVMISSLALHASRCNLTTTREIEQYVGIPIKNWDETAYNTYYDERLKN